ncbi:MAG: ABC-F family ATP-binding cassette domain-containing protein [Acidimicrobiales bacterium]
MLSLFDIRIEIGARVLVRDATVQIRAGEKVALVGANGAGKTTLLRNIAGEGALAAGSVQRPRHTAYLRQEAPGLHGELPDSELAIEYLLAASPLWAMRRQLEELTSAMSSLHGTELTDAIHQFSGVQERFVHHGGYGLEAEAERIAKGVGLTEDDLLTGVGELSGGQRRKLDLASVLLTGGELFLLDEPTNHLDAVAKRWVMNFLRDTPATVLVVSHDIRLIDSAIDRVLSLENAQIDSYRGTYSSFLAQRDAAETQRAHVAANLTKEAARLEATKKIFAKANATHASKRRALQRRIDALNGRLRDHAPRVHTRPLAIRFPEPVRSGDVAIRVVDLVKSFGERRVLDGLDFTIHRGDLLLVVGVNGAGKTTLLRCLGGRESPDNGRVQVGAKVQIGYYAQEHEDLTLDATVLDNARLAAPAMGEGTLRSALGHFGLVGDVAHQSARSLSGGEKTKLALASLMLRGTNVLLLDEPTNNLDPASVEALLAALQHYEGTVVLVSHDADFVSQLAPERVVLLPEGRVAFFDQAMAALIEQR